jgi:hypothetical protein
VNNSEEPDRDDQAPTSKEGQSPIGDYRFDSKDFRDGSLGTAGLLVLKELFKRLPDFFRSWNEHRRVRIEEERWELDKKLLSEKAESKEQGKEKKEKQS